MKNYDVDDPNRLELNWENKDKWIQDTNFCKAAVDWWKNKENDMTIEHSKNPSEVESNAEVLEALIADKKYEWANWFVVRMLNKKDYIAYARFAEAQLPDIVLGNEHFNKAVQDAKDCSVHAETHDSASAAGKVFEHSVQANALSGLYNNTNEIKLKILNYGLELLLKNRTGK